MTPLQDRLLFNAQATYGHQDSLLCRDRVGPSIISALVYCQMPSPFSTDFPLFCDPALFSKNCSGPLVLTSPRPLSSCLTGTDLGGH